jgi:hypothetical protein
MDQYVEPKGQLVLECECGEQLVIFGVEDDWRSRHAIFKCECGQKLSLGTPADELSEEGAALYSG